MNPGSAPEGTHIAEGKSINKKEAWLATKAQDEFAHLANRMGVKRSDFFFFNWVYSYLPMETSERLETWDIT